MKLFDKQSMALLVSVISISVLCIISVSYAYFTTQIKGNENATSIELVMGTMKIKYEDSNLVTLNNAIPGDTIKHNFKVTNTGTLETTYNIKIDIEKNNFRDKSDLEYTLTRNNEKIKEGNLPYEDGYIVVGEEIGTEEETKINNYELEVRFKKDEEEKDQNDNKNRELKFKIVIDTKEEASLYEFIEPYKDESGANYPELYEGLIPVTYTENNEMKIAKITEEWYNYDEHKWANAVLIDHNNPEIINKFYKEDGTLRGGDTITENDILQMYVWIPRYKYQLFNAVAGETSNPQMINITFEKNDYSTGNVSCEYINHHNGTIEEKCIDAENGNWYTHPAFTFGDTELRGIWVGKFEPSEKDKGTEGVINEKDADIQNITILPNKVSIVNKKIKITFDAVKNFPMNSQYKLDYNEIDTHMMKNMEWGAVAYLSSSKYGFYNSDGKSCTIEGCRVWNNDISHGASESSNDGTITGCSGSSADAQPEYNKNACNENYTWKTGGTNASTTGNVYGIYDMSGGMWEYVMGNMVNTDGTFYSVKSGFIDKNPEIKAKYYDSYEFGNSVLDYKKGHLGDSTREVLEKIGVYNGGWDNDYAGYASELASWFVRGGYVYADTVNGIFASGRNGGSGVPYNSFRVVLTAQDGEE